MLCHPTLCCCMCCDHDAHAHRSCRQVHDRHFPLKSHQHFSGYPSYASGPPYPSGDTTRIRTPLYKILLTATPLQLLLNTHLTAFRSGHHLSKKEDTQLANQTTARKASFFIAKGFHLCKSLIHNTKKGITTRNASLLEVLLDHSLWQLKICRQSIDHFDTRPTFSVHRRHWNNSGRCQGSIHSSVGPCFL